MSSATDAMCSVENPTLSEAIDFTEFLQSQCGTPASQSPEPILEADPVDSDPILSYDETLNFDLTDADLQEIARRVDLSLAEQAIGAAETEGGTMPAVETGNQALYSGQMATVVAGDASVPPLDLDPWPLYTSSEIKLHETTVKLEEMTKRKERWKQQAHAERDRRVRSEHQLDQIRHVICSASPAQRLPPTPRRTPVTPKRSIDTMTNDLSLSVPQMVRLTDPLSDGPLPIRGRRLTFSSPSSRAVDGSSSPAETILLATPSPAPKKQKQRGRSSAIMRPSTARRSRRKATGECDTKHSKAD